MQFSVIIPARNAAGSLAKAIVSALNQEEVTVEVIVVDDGSTDETGRVAHEIRERDCRVVVLHNSSSAGVSAARNRALAAAQGGWVALLDADDEFLPGRLIRMAREAERCDLDMVADNLALRSEAGADLGLAFAETELQGDGAISFDTFLLHDIPHRHPMGIGYCKPIMSRAFLTKNSLSYRLNLPCAEDFMLYSECLMAGSRFGFSKIAGYLYTIRSNGHGTAFNLQASRVNRLVMSEAKKLKPSSLPILKMRQRALDYHAFANSARARQYVEAATSLIRLPPLYLVQRGLKSAAMRMGMSAE